MSSLRIVSTTLLVASTMAGTTSNYHRVGPHGTLPVSNWQACAPPPVLCSEQVHLQLGGADEMVVVYTSMNAKVKSEVHFGTDKGELSKTAVGSQTSYSQLMTFTALQSGHGRFGVPTMTDEEIQKIQDTSDWAISKDFSSSYKKVNVSADPFEVGNETVWDFSGDYKNPQAYYNSPMVHTVVLSNLTANQKYYYVVDALETVFDFTMPAQFSRPEEFTKLRMGLMADLGQTNASHQNIEQMSMWGLDVILLSGDLSYADGYGPLWDSYGRMMQGLAAYVPIMVTPGNHDVASGIESLVAYSSRYPMPYKQSGAFNNDHWSRNIGPVHVISLSSYAATDPSSFQYQWLMEDLANVERLLTPWVIVMSHVPWYHSNENHKNEAYLMMLDMEDILYKAGVDIVLNGHVHAYERTTGVYKNLTDECGPIYLTMGDGGNREGAATPWKMPQPEWSVFREASFGVGQISFINATHANLEWLRAACDNVDYPYREDFHVGCNSTLDNSDNKLEASDLSWVIKPSHQSCPNRY